MNNEEKESDSQPHFLDITSLVCPMTFVKTRILIDGMQVGERARIRLKGQEPIENVPRSLVELGHEILSMEPEDPGSATFVLDVLKH